MATTKPEFAPGCRRFDTSRLPVDISISDGDWTCEHFGRVVRAEFKARLPILNRVQLVEFQQKHLLI